MAFKISGCHQGDWLGSLKLGETWKPLDQYFMSIIHSLPIVARKSHEGTKRLN